MPRTDLVLEGGGVRGIALAGAIVSLADAGWEFPRVAGTSAGAVVGSVVAALQRAGRPLSELHELMGTLDYARVSRGTAAERRLGIVGEIGHLLLHDGLYDGDYLHGWLTETLGRLGVRTFADLRQDDPDSSLPDGDRYSLVVTTSDVTRGKLVRLPWDYHAYGIDPHTAPVADAVRASMSIPFFFNPVRLLAPAYADASGEFPADEVVWVDGGLLSNFPVELFDRTDGQPARWPTLGVKLSSRRPATAGRAAATFGVVDLAAGCARALLDNADRYYVLPDKADRTVFVDTAGISATDFGLSGADQDELYAEGRQAAEHWLAREGRSA